MARGKPGRKLSYTRRTPREHAAAPARCIQMMSAGGGRRRARSAAHLAQLRVCELTHVLLVVAMGLHGYTMDISSSSSCDKQVELPKPFCSWGLSELVGTQCLESMSWYTGSSPWGLLANLCGKSRTVSKLVRRWVCGCAHVHVCLCLCVRVCVCGLCVFVGSHINEKLVQLVLASHK